MIKVVRLSLTPVKSTVLHHPEEIRLEEFGVAEDRRFYLIDERGKLFSGFKYGPMVRIRAEYDALEERLTLHLPGARAVEGDATSTGEAVTTNFWDKRELHGQLLDGPFNAALSKYADRPLRLVRCDGPRNATDVHPVTIMSSASVEELRRRAGRDEPLDGRRFRMLIEVDGCGPHEEDTWGGKSARVGDAVIRVLKPVPRCVVTTQSPDTGVRDFSTLKQLASYRGITKERDINFGVYADVVEPGVIRVGDEIVV
ncbi:MAG: MOSC domain-containing protein [Actinomycetota bacterium]